ncbi:UPF0489 protein C5orf22 homolog [Symsagittifera roscoffensis]|uniref:UPF0489 protein C5orf22 homolog n=1 Tax=Symsagittifera roscoffensis TaxID=84072 RepID=UPI00307BEB86
MASGSSRHRPALIRQQAQTTMPQHMLNLESRIAVNIVEDHDDALHIIYREIGAKRIPFANLALIHFDAHPDLMIPETLQADDIKDKSALFASLGIENWILPAVYAGHFSTIVWIHPPWANQLPDTDPDKPLDLVIGKDPVSGLLKISCVHDYFLSALVYAPPERLKNQVPFKLYVLNSSDEQCISTVRTITLSQKYILDIDLDYFSCLNPFKGIFSPSDFEIIRSYYDFEPPTSKSERRSINMCLSKRRRQIDALENIVLKGKTGTVEYNALTSVLKKGHDPEIVHNCGMTFDTTELPHHKSSELEIKSSMYDFSHLVASAFSSSECCPSLVTIARSSLDDYCPKDQVDRIQYKVIECLEEFYQMMGVYYHFDFVEYKDENGSTDRGSTDDEMNSAQFEFLNSIQTA